MKFPVPTKKTMLVWGTGIVLSIAGYFVYTADSAAPRLVSFEMKPQNFVIDENDDTTRKFAFTGQITDDRGAGFTEITCKRDGQTILMYHVALSGADKYKVSFGEHPGSFKWEGRWAGNIRDVNFEGSALIPKNSKRGVCAWEATLRDVLGNATTQQLNATTEIR